jgi:N-hydroxyarylamine O-acetyltransferase
VARQDDLIHRIGLASAPEATVDGLREVHRAYVESVPFEAITVQLGESAPLDPDALVERMLHGGRGGYCFEVNTVFRLLLESLGFAVEQRQAVVGARGAHVDEPTNHLALVVDVPGGGRWIAEAGLGEGPIDPLPLAAGVVRAGAWNFTIERENGGWWVGCDERSSTPGFRFADAPATLADFEPHHQRLSTSPDSGFVRTLVVQQPHEDRIVTLRARTLTIDRPSGRDRSVVPDEAAFAAALRDQFGIELDPDRLSRLWNAACRQHAEWLPSGAATAR